MADSRVVRALLTVGLNNKEPLGNISLPISVTENKAVRVYYFTEIVNMKGQSLFHQWTWNNQIVYKKEIKILGNRWRASTSKMIINSKVGVWNTRLVNKEGVILNEIKFKVVHE